MWPLVLSAAGILACIITSFFATHVMSVKEEKHIERTLRWQLIISTLILTPTIVILGLYGLPKTFSFVYGSANALIILDSTNWGVMTCALCGLYAGLIIGYITDYFTSNQNQPTQDLARACVSGAAINIIQGLALGYLSCAIPIIAISSKF